MFYRWHPDISGRLWLRTKIGVLLFGLLMACGNSSVKSTEDRLLPLESTLNARDLGGYATADGRRVKWGILFRTDSLANLTPDDVAQLAKLKLAVVTDFRSDAERADAPDRLPQQSPTLRYQTLAINNPARDTKELARKIYSGQVSEGDLRALSGRESYVENIDISREWGAWLAGLSDSSNLPHLFHCTAGKDRTGFAAALVLLTLGVPPEQVMEDFLLSNHYLASKIDVGVATIQAASEVEIDEQVLRDVIGVTPRSLESALDAMELKYGSVDGYIEHGLGIDSATRSRLQNLLLE